MLGATAANALIRAVAIAQNACHLPPGSNVSPDDCELGSAVASVIGNAAELMRALSDGTKVLDRKNRQRSWDQLAAILATGVLGRVCQHRRSIPSYTTSIVIKLYIGREIALVPLQFSGITAAVERVKSLSIDLRYRVQQESFWTYVG